MAQSTPPPGAAAQLSRNDFDEAMNAPGVASDLARLSRDQDRRSTRQVEPLAITLDSDSDFTGFPPSGTVMLMFSPSGTSQMSDFATAFLGADHDRLGGLQSQVRSAVTGRPLLTMAQAVDKLIANPVYFDFRYGTKPLALGVGLHDGMDLGAMLFPTNGGAIHPEDFSVLEYRDSPTSRDGYDYLVVTREAALTDLERRVLAAVPSSQTEMNISSGATIAGFPAVIGYVVVATLVGTACLSASDALDRIHLTEEQVRQLGPHASARTLLGMRREAFEHAQSP